MSEDNQKKIVCITTSVASASEEKQQDNLVVEEESRQESTPQLKKTKHTTSSKCTPQLKRRKIMNWMTIDAIHEAIDKLICIAHRILSPKDVNDMHDVVDLYPSPTKVNESIGCLEEEENPKVKRGNNHDNACFDQSGEALNNFRNKNEPKEVPIQPQPIPRVPVLLPRQPYPQWWSRICPHNEPFFNRGSSSTNGNDYKGKEVVTDDENGFTKSWRVLTWGPSSYMEKPQMGQAQLRATFQPSNISFQEWVEDMHEKGFFSQSELSVMLSYKEMMDRAMRSSDNSTQSPLSLASKITTDTDTGATHNHHQFLPPPPTSDTTPLGPRASRGLHQQHTRSSGRIKRKPSRFKDFCM